MFRERGRNVSGSRFERIRSESERRPCSPGIQQLRDSIKRNLHAVLNTRPGSCSSAPALGVSDAGEDDEEQRVLGFREAQIKRIRQCIEDYEPRISHVEVTAGALEENNPLALIFRIFAYVTLDDNEQLLEFNVHLDSNQHYKMD